MTSPYDPTDEFAQIAVEKVARNIGRIVGHPDPSLKDAGGNDVAVHFHIRTGPPTDEYEMPSVAILDDSRDPNIHDFTLRFPTLPEHRRNASQDQHEAEWATAVNNVARRHDYDPDHFDTSFGYPKHWVPHIRYDGPTLTPNQFNTLLNAFKDAYHGL